MNPREEIKDIAPILSSEKLDNGYTMPDNYFEKMQSAVMQEVETENLESYFDALPDQLMARIENENKKQNTPRLKYLSRVAAVAGLVFVSVWTFNTISTDTTETYAAMTEEELDEMILLAEDLSLEELVEVGIITDDNIDDLLPEINDEIDLNNYIDEYDEEELVDLL